MKNEHLNYQAVLVLNDQVVDAFEFHADSAALATDHIQHVANVGYQEREFDCIEYRRKGALNWKVVRPKEYE